MSKSPGGLGGQGPDFAKAFSLAFEFVGAVLIFWLVGRWIDNRFDIEPWAQVSGAVIGWVGGFLHIYYKLKGVAWETVPGTRRPAATQTPQGGQASPRSSKAAASGDGDEALGGTR